jgi:hypothetical protein
MQGLRSGSWRLGLWALILAALAVPFKVQIVLAYSLPLAAFILWRSSTISRAARWAAAVAIIAAFFLVAAITNQIPNAPTLGVTFGRIWTFFDVRLLSPVFPDGIPAVARLALLPAAPLAEWMVTYGILIPIAGWLAWLSRKDVAARNILILLFTMLGSHAFIRLFLADNQGFGDPHEITRKTFAWPYFVVVFCTAALICLRARPEAISRILGSRWATGMAAVMLLPLGMCAPRVQYSHGMTQFTHVDIPLGLLQAAVHLRRNAAEWDVVQLCQNDPYNQLGTLAERPVYIAKIMINAAPMNSVERSRFAVLERIVQEGDHAKAEDQLREAGIDWLLLSPDCKPDWEAGVRGWVTSNGYRLLHVPKR